MPKAPKRPRDLNEWAETFLNHPIVCGDEERQEPGGGIGAPRGGFQSPPTGAAS